MSNFNSEKFLANVTSRPGIYQMLNNKGEVLYVGKARDLKRRLCSYFRANLIDPKTCALMSEVADISITITASENEALLLESNLIKKLRPHYNILLKDDKSFPYLFLSGHSDYPRLDIHRGPQRLEGKYFGPYPSARSVHETLDLLQKLFKIRQCKDSFFKNRTRPCLQYQIKRCTAPCVNFIQPAEYQENVLHAELFLQGKSTQIIDELIKKMETASNQMNFEEAARYRDQIISLRRIQEQQYVSTNEGDVDVLAVVINSGVICVHILFIRAGRLIGNKSYFPEVHTQITEDEALAAFLPQYYLSSARGESLPKKIVVNCKVSEVHWIQNALSELLKRKITISRGVRGNTRQWLQMAELNAKHALVNYLSNKLHFYQRLQALQTELKLENLPERIECFDISHTMGEATVASCVVFDAEGPAKKDYRRFNIHDVQAGDDYAAIKQALSRHYANLKSSNGNLPDILIIDGGKGQLTQAEHVLEELQVSGVTLLAIAKGPTRKPGFETIFLSRQASPLALTVESPALHVLQQIRDEAHRFAITGHRQRRAKTRSKSFLENIPGIGANRRRELLRQFGGLQEIKRASIDEIAKIPGISRELATRIYEALHG